MQAWTEETGPADLDGARGTHTIGVKWSDTQASLGWRQNWASGVWTVQGLPARGHRTDSRDKRSIGERKRHRKKDSERGSEGQGERAGRLPRESTDKHALGDCKQHNEIQGVKGQETLRNLLIKSTLLIFLIGFSSSSRQL